MCRLAYFAANHGLSEETLGLAFKELENSMGGTGSGLAIYKDGKWVDKYYVHGKGAESLAQHAHANEGCPILFHARAASSGDDCPENLMPFLHPKIILAHNGHFSELNWPSLWKVYLGTKFKPSDSYVLATILDTFPQEQIKTLIEQFSGGHVLMVGYPGKDGIEIFHSKPLAVYGTEDEPKIFASETLVSIPSKDKNIWRQIWSKHQWDHVTFFDKKAEYTTNPEKPYVYSPRPGYHKKASCYNNWDDWEGESYSGASTTDTPPITNNETAETIITRVQLSIRTCIFCLKVIPVKDVLDDKRCFQCKKCQKEITPEIKRPFEVYDPFEFYCLDHKTKITKLATHLIKNCAILVNYEESLRFVESVSFDKTTLDTVYHLFRMEYGKKYEEKVPHKKFEERKKQTLEELTEKYPHHFKKIITN